MPGAGGEGGALEEGGRGCPFLLSQRAAWRPTPHPPPLGTPLGLAQRKRASPRGEAGPSGFLCVSVFGSEAVGR